MRDVSNKLFLCYAWEDMARVQQLVLETEHEIDAKITSGPLKSDITEVNDEVSDRIADSDIFVVFISDAAKKSEFVRECVLRASQLNKNILPVEIDRQGIFGTKTPAEFKFRSKTYDVTDPQTKAAYFAQLKASLGFSVEDGDAFGSLIHIVTDRDARIIRYGKEIGYAQPNVDGRIRLAKGSHQLRIEDAQDPTLYIIQTIDVLDNESEDFIEIPMNRLLQEKQERQEQERYEAETRKKIEREQFEQNERLKLQRQMEEEERQRELQAQREREEAQRQLIEQQRQEAERQKKADEWLKHQQEYLKNNSDNKSGGSSCLVTILVIAGIALLISLL